MALPNDSYEDRFMLRTLILSVVGCCLPVFALAAEPVPEKLVVLTFDDSVKSHFTVVRPILKKYHFGARAIRGVYEVPGGQ